VKSLEPIPHRPGDTRGRRPDGRRGRRDRECRIRLVLDDDPVHHHAHHDDSVDDDPIDGELTLRQLPVAGDSLRRATARLPGLGAAPELFVIHDPRMVSCG
jgi:hypothetical protein